MHCNWLRNFWRNIWFLISAAAFFAVNVRSISTAVGIAVAGITHCVVACRIEKLGRTVFQKPRGVLCLSVAAAVGTSVANAALFYQFLVDHCDSATAVLTRFVPVSSAQVLLAGKAVSVVCAVLAVPYLTVLFAAAYTFLLESAQKWIKRFGKADAWAFGACCLGLFVLICYAFHSTSALYRAGTISCDLVYTSDSPTLLQNNAWLYIFQYENDLRQPLFAIFAAPFFAPVYLVSLCFSWIAAARAALYAMANAFLIAVSMLLLADLLEKDAVRRRILAVLLLCLYGSCLHSLMPEQYAVAVFWLIFFLHRSLEKGEQRELVYVGATGTLLTSAVSLPLLCIGTPKGKKGKLLPVWNAVKTGVLFALFFGRVDIVLKLFTTTRKLMEFTGQGMPLSGRVLQYVSFVSDCFLAPKAALAPNADALTSWQLETVSSVNRIGVCILVLCALGFVLNHKNVMARICAVWVGFSFVVLCLVGWGTAENGLILYSLYFGWAFCVLLYLLVRSCMERLHIQKALPFVVGAASIALLAVNLPEIAQMFNALATVYPA